MENPTIIIHRNATMKGLRLPTRSDTYAKKIAIIAAVMYIGTVMSCAVLEEYPKFLMMVGRKRLTPYSGHTIFRTYWVSYTAGRD